MRKPSSMPLRHVTILSLAVLAAMACDRADQSRTNKSATDSVIDGSGAAVGSSASAGIRRELSAAGAPTVMDERAAVAMSAPAAAPMPQSRAANVAARDAQRADFSRGVPLPAVDPTGAMLVRHGQASIQVKAVESTVSAVRQTAAQYGGFVANTSLRTGKDEQRSATLELRVPSDKFDGLLSSLSSLGKVESVTASAEDVAEEYVDLGARVANARRVEA